MQDRTPRAVEIPDTEYRAFLPAKAEPVHVRSFSPPYRLIMGQMKAATKATIRLAKTMRTVMMPIR